MKKIIFYFCIFFVAHLNASALELQEEPFFLSILVFTALILVLLIYFYKKIQNIKQDNEQKLHLQEQINQQQNKLLSEIGEEIQHLANENVELVKKISQSNKEVSLSEEFHSFENSETQLLSISTNLIEFLRIKSKKTLIQNEKFSFSNLLNDVSGTLKEIIQERPLHLYYNLQENFNDTIYGDTLNLSKILTNIILYSVENQSKQIVLHVSNINAYSKDKKLYFTIQTDLKMDVENSHSIFTSKYNEKTGTYKSLGLFIARELSLLMNGELIARNTKDGFLEFMFEINYEEDTQTNHSEKITSKKILLLDFSSDALMSTHNILANLGHEVKSLLIDTTLKISEDFSNYDLIIAEESICTKDFMQSLEPSNTLVCLSNLFGPTHHLDLLPDTITLKQPLTQKHLEECFKNIYSQKAQEQNTSEEKLKIYKNTFADAKDVTLHQFAQFRGSSILLVEDNFINQKVVLGILSKSGIAITIANNGQEALDILNSDATFQLVLMDINMPIMDGYTAAKQIRRNVKYNTLPIIALSALTSKLEVESMFASGMNGFLAKPLKKEKLYSALSMFVSEKKEERRQSIRYEERKIALEGLNTQLGLQNTNSNEFFYREILVEFQDAYGESDTVFSKLVNDFRYEQLRMLALDVRGLAASIGAQDMNLLAAEVLKLLLFKKYEILQDFIPLYTKALQKLNYSIDTYLSK